jgi:hypothetical protein
MSFMSGTKFGENTPQSLFRILNVNLYYGSQFSHQNAKSNYPFFLCRNQMTLYGVG